MLTKYGYDQAEWNGFKIGFMFGVLISVGVAIVGLALGKYF
jgi:hypothetical protein